jgi:uncharacterized membrane protein
MRLLLLLHVAAGVLFVGNIAVGLFWVGRGRRNGDRRVLRHTFLSVDASDTLLTLPSVLVLLATGFALAIRMGLPVLGTGWLLWSNAAFALSGATFAVGVLPLQRRLAGAFDDAGARPNDERGALLARWARWAHASFAFAVVALVLMVVKPALPGLGR